MRHTTPATGRSPRTMPTIHPCAAGVDVGATFHVVAVPPECADDSVRTFRSFTEDLHQLADWLQAVGVTTVAMESTGIYWIPVYEILEARGLEVLLVNARDVKTVPGRKSDVNDAQWLQQLHQFGLLRGSFRPTASVLRVRALVRHRESLVESAATYIQRMQKAMMQMNDQLQHVVTDITGVTGLRIIRDIAAGVHDPVQLAAHRDVRCKQPPETIRQALIGHYQPEHVFALRQTLELYDVLQRKIAETDVEIAGVLAALHAADPAPSDPLPPIRHTKSRNEPDFDIRQMMYLVFGADLSQIHGVGPYTILRLVAECGTDMHRWPTVKHFTSWLTLCPGTKISGGRVLSAHTRRSASRPAALLRIAAVNVGRTQTALGGFYRRLAARIGKAKAVTATARKLAVLFYNAMRFGMQYIDPGADHYDATYKQRVIDNLARRARQLGYALTKPIPPAAPGVS